MKPVSAARYAFGYKRTLDHLRAWQLVLPRAVREVVVSLSLRGKRHSGTRLFLHENIPQLKYHNPDVKLAVERHRDPHSKINFILQDGSCQSIVTTDLRQRDIQEKITEHDFEEHPT